ncbi:hypothetical protein ABIB27_000150 [Arthrobacter sp. UYEF21]
MAQLTTDYGTGFSTISISGTPPCGLSDKQWRALGDLARDVSASQAELPKLVPADAPKRPGSGWSITARTAEIGPISATAQSILAGNLTALRDLTTESQ